MKTQAWGTRQFPRNPNLPFLSLFFFLIYFLTGGKLLYKLVLVSAAKKEFIGPGLHLRPVHADHAQPPFQWTLNSVLSAYENDNRKIRPPPERGTLKIISRLLIT